MLRRLNVSAKVKAVVAVPMLVLLLAGVFIGWGGFADFRAARASAQVVTTLVDFTQVVRAEHDEWIVSSDTARTPEGLAAARAATDTAIAAATVAAQGVDLGGLDEAVRESMDNLLRTTSLELPRVRARVDGDGTMIDNSYQSLIAAPARLAETFADKTSDRTTAPAIDAYGVLLDYQLDLTTERIAGTLLQSAPTSVQKLADFRSAYAAVEVSRAHAAGAADDFGASGDGDKVRAMAGALRLARSTLSGSDATAIAAIGVDTWNELEAVQAETAVQAELDILDTAAASARATVSTTQAAMLGTVGVVVLATIASFLAAGLVARRIVVPLKKLTEATDKVRQDLPLLVEQVAVPGQTPDLDLPRIPVESNDEVGRLAAAFNEVNATTLQVAQAQAALRGSIAEMFVNVARRDQVLLNRQLAFVDTLERTEEDPTALANLFHLDHLATRMRRNAESLLVLAGIDSGRRLREPMPLSDVIRTASSEIEQYDRVELDLTVDPHMLAFNALPAAHLLAELLENSTVFSEPETPVEVSTGYAGELVVVSILDHGIGMSDVELETLNERLKAVSAGDALGAQRLGLYVVARLARRLGADVEVRRGPSGSGTLTVVRFPAPLFQSVEALPGNGGLAPAPEAREVDLAGLTDGETDRGLPRRRTSTRDDEEFVLPEVAGPASLETGLAGAEAGWAPLQMSSPTTGSLLPARSRAAAPEPDEIPVPDLAAIAEPADGSGSGNPAGSADSGEPRRGLFGGFRGRNRLAAEEVNGTEPGIDSAIDGHDLPETWPPAETGSYGNVDLEAAIAAGRDLPDTWAAVDGSEATASALAEASGDEHASEPVADEHASGSAAADSATGSADADSATGSADDPAAAGFGSAALTGHEAGPAVSASLSTAGESTAGEPAAPGRPAPVADTAGPPKPLTRRERRAAERAHSDHTEDASPSPAAVADKAWPVAPLWGQDAATFAFDPIALVPDEDEAPYSPQLLPESALAQDPAELWAASVPSDDLERGAATLDVSEPDWADQLDLAAEESWSPRLDLSAAPLTPVTGADGHTDHQIDGRTDRQVDASAADEANGLDTAGADDDLAAWAPVDSLPTPSWWAPQDASTPWQETVLSDEGAEPPSTDDAAESEWADLVGRQTAAQDGQPVAAHDAAAAQDGQPVAEWGWGVPRQLGAAEADDALPAGSPVSADVALAPQAEQVSGPTEQGADDDAQIAVYSFGARTPVTGASAQEAPVLVGQAEDAAQPGSQAPTASAPWPFAPVHGDPTGVPDGVPTGTVPSQDRAEAEVPTPEKAKGKRRWGLFRRGRTDAVPTPSIPITSEPTPVVASPARAFGAAGREALSPAAPVAAWSPTTSPDPSAPTGGTSGNTAGAAYGVPFAGTTTGSALTGSGATGFGIIGTGASGTGAYGADLTDGAATGFGSNGGFALNGGSALNGSALNGSALAGSGAGSSAHPTTGITGGGSWTPELAQTETPSAAPAGETLGMFGSFTARRASADRPGVDEPAAPAAEPAVSSWRPTFGHDGDSSDRPLGRVGTIEDDMSAMLALRSGIEEQALAELSQLSSYRPTMAGASERLAKRVPSEMPAAAPAGHRPVQRDADELRARLASFQSGSHRGRRAGLTPQTTEADPS